MTNTYVWILLRIMKSKLTLSVDRDAIAKAKQLARRKGVSVSALFEQWSTRIAESEDRAALSERLKGTWSVSPSVDKDARMEYLMDKHCR